MIKMARLFSMQILNSEWKGAALPGYPEDDRASPDEDSSDHDMDTSASLASTEKDTINRKRKSIDLSHFTEDDQADSPRPRKQ